MKNSRKNKYHLWTKKVVYLYGTILVLISGLIIIIDPYMQYHRPWEHIKYDLEATEVYCWGIGLTRNIDYDAIICGTSMTSNFSTYEMDILFDVNSIKVPLLGASSKTVSNLLKEVFSQNNQIKYVIQSLDMDYYCSGFKGGGEPEPDTWQYLWNDKYYDDCSYVCSKEILLKTILSLHNLRLIEEYSLEYPISKWEGIKGAGYVIPSAYNQGMKLIRPETEAQLSATEQQIIEDKIYSDFIENIENNKNTSFIIFIPPYSAIWWGDINSRGMLNKQLTAERIIIEELLKYDNVEIYSFNCCEDITTNLDNYIDPHHYVSQINSYMLKSFSDGNFQLKNDNYLDYLKCEYEIYSNMNYSHYITDDENLVTIYGDMISD